MGKRRPFERRKDLSLPEDIQKLRDLIGAKLAELEAMLGDRAMSNRSVGIEFPRGFIRKASYWKGRWKFVEDKALVTDLAYRAQAHDCLRWLMNRFDIDLSVLITIAFASVVLIASICEGLCYAACAKVMAQRAIKQTVPRKFKGLINMLHGSLHIVDRELADKLHSLRKLRNDLHVYNSAISGESIYPPLGSDVEKQAMELLHKHNEAVTAYYELVECLEQYFASNKE